MSNRAPILLASLALSALLADRPGMSAISGSDTAAAETAIRKADADWAATARTASVDGWMAFYSADAIVLAPNVQIASDRELVRQTVTSLLTLRHLSIAWHAIKVEVAASGDLAYLIGVYELRYDDASGARVSDRGKLLEIWRKQSDGGWKCSVDTWNSDGPAAAAAAQAAPPTGPVGRPPTAVSEPPSPAAYSVPPAQSSVQALTADYGEMPTQYDEAVRQYFQQYLKDPDSVRFQEITKPERGYVTTVTGAIFTHEVHLKGWTVKATINARNSRGVYVGFKTYTFLFRGEKIVHTISPLSDGEMK